MEVKELKTRKRGKILGVDYGDVRTGLAVCDLSGFLASGIGTIKPGGMRNTAMAVAEEAKKQGAVLIVIGLPKNMDGTEGFRADAVRSFGKLLEEYTEVPYTYYDERLSTCCAHQILNITDTGGKKRKTVIDMLSAEIILQNFMDATPIEP
ncbi:MAG: Holliday junction resolvase RuvX [Clostridia bacterium]|nr:Holliday junction resolvase RuvX [Clostridia bacterium]